MAEERTDHQEKRYSGAKTERTKQKAIRDKHVKDMKDAKKAGNTAAWRKAKTKVQAQSRLMRAQAHVMHKNQTKDQVVASRTKGEKHWSDKITDYQKRIDHVTSKGGKTKDWSDAKRAAHVGKLTEAWNTTKKRKTAYEKRMDRYK